MFYWEHLGLMHDEAYRQKFKYKEELYARAGIRRNDQLIVTEDHDGVIDLQEVRLILAMKHFM